MRGQDLTVMLAPVEGRTGTQDERHACALVDPYDSVSDVSSVDRAAGYHCTAMVRVLARGLDGQPGIAPPELVGADPDCSSFLPSELNARGVKFEHRVEEIAD